MFVLCDFLGNGNINIGEVGKRNNLSMTFCESINYAIVIVIR